MIDTVSSICADLEEQEANYLGDSYRKYYELQYFDKYLRKASYHHNQKDLVVEHAIIYVAFDIPQIKIVIKSL